MSGVIVVGFTGAALRFRNVAPHTPRGPCNTPGAARHFDGDRCTPREETSRDRHAMPLLECERLNHETTNYMLAHGEDVMRITLRAIGDARFFTKAS
jgi:hypothetical protein